ncbi:MAG: 8-oxoguanine glycosylase ogg1 [Pycnora praestabilis]|nr:MAG: 8-oxoguanine glycosylase ogg1 [Pycnora praestabilis]
MSTMHSTEWCKLPISLTELCIDTSLRCGQSFRWRKSNDDIWSCTLHGRILSLRQDPTHLHYRAIFPATNAPPTPPSSAPPSTVDPSSDEDDTTELVQHYFNVRPNLTDLYDQWSTADLNFKKKAPKFTGVRILKQDAWEALVGFICSSNNNIVRISQMVEKLCIHYGPLIGHIDDQPYFDFPPASSLTGPNVESHLRQLGFGYRAKYLYQTALMIADARESGWLDSLRNPESPLLGIKPRPAGEMLEGGREGYRAAHTALLELQGVGPKVADCVCLMGLGWGEAVPVDTHVWQIAQRDYKFGKGKHRSLTKATYDAVGDYFRYLWGKEAGWAHSVLFTADLRAFSERLSAKMEVEEEKTSLKLESGVKILQEKVNLSVKAEDAEESVKLKDNVKSEINDRNVKREWDDDDSESKASKVKKLVVTKRAKKRRKT